MDSDRFHKVSLPWAAGVGAAGLSRQTQTSAEVSLSTLAGRPTRGVESRQGEALDRPAPSAGAKRPRRACAK